MPRYRLKYGETTEFEAQSMMKEGLLECVD